MLRRHIRVREVNRYLSEVVSELQTKHGGVTSDAFEQELEDQTGIGWKQVKNYRNHPAPDQIIRPNSKVKAFIYESRRRAFFRELQSPRTVVRAAVVVAMLGVVYQFGYKPILHRRSAEVLSADKKREAAPEKPNPAYRPVIKFTIQAVGTTLQLGKLTSQMKAMKWNPYYSQSGGYRRLDYAEPTGNPLMPLLIRLTYNLETEDVTTFEIRTMSPSVIAALKEQIEEQTQSGFTHDDKKENWEGQSEFLSAVTEYNPLARADRHNMFVVTLTSKFH